MKKGMSRIVVMVMVTMPSLLVAMVPAMPPAPSEQLTQAAVAQQPVVPLTTVAGQAMPSGVVTPSSQMATDQAAPATSTGGIEPVPPSVVPSTPGVGQTPQLDQQVNAAVSSVTTQPSRVSGTETLPIVSSEQTGKAQSATSAQASGKQENLAVQEEKKDIYLNFENADLSSFIDYIAEIKKLNILLEKPIEGAKISLTIREPLTIEGAWKIFLTVLDMSGYSIVQAGEIHKVIARDKKNQQPLPAYVNVSADKLPDSDLTIRYVFFLSNLQIASVQPLLESMLVAPNNVVPLADMNAFIMTDKANNIKAAAKLLYELDQMGMPETVTVLRLKQVNAVDVKALLESLIRKPDISPLARLLGKVSEGTTDYFAPTTRFIAEERTNSLILLGNNKAIDKVIDFITKNIDTEIKAAESPLHIYELQNIDAKQVADILKEVTAAPDSTTGQAAGKFGAIRGGVKYFRPMTFQIDKDGNRLIVSCVDKQDWKLLKKTLDDLDKPQPQIALETLIVTVDVTDEKALSGSIRNKKTGQLGANNDFQAAMVGVPSLVNNQSGSPVSIMGNLLDQIVATQGQSILTFGKDKNIWAVFTAFKHQTNSSILSQPFITVANKTVANIVVGETRRIIDSQQNNAAGGGVFTGYKDTNASTKVSVVPQINIDGVIRLDMTVDIVDFVDPAGNITTQRMVKTNVTVADGQVLVLGGFVKTKIDESTYKTPILGDIPVLGWFFKNKARTIRKEYLFIFMSPTIIKPRQTPGMQLYTKMKLHQATDNIEDTVDTRRNLDPIQNWFFNPDKENYSHKVIDFANARYQPTTVDIHRDPYYRAQAEKTDNERVKAVETTDAPSSTIMPQLQPSIPTVATPVSVNAAVRVPEVTVVPQALPQVRQSEKQQMQREEVKPELHVTENGNDSVTGRRQKLKELLVPPPVAVAQTVLQKPVDQLVRNNVKEQAHEGLRSIISDETFQPPETSSLMDNMKKRNVLKEFLSSNPALAHENNKTELPRRKAKA